MELVEDSGDDREYQRFLSSLLPHEQENLSFLDEEDEEYEPEEDEDDEREAENSKELVKISKKELSELLWDSTHSRLPLVSNDIKPGEYKRNSLNGVASCSGVWPPRAPLPVPPPPSLLLAASAAAAGRATPTGSVEGVAMPVRRLHHSAATRYLQGGLKKTTPFHLQHTRATLTQQQCIQLASQMHKHFQLLLQNYHLFANDPENAQHVAARDECLTMLQELQARGRLAQQCKGALLSRLNPGTATASNSATSASISSPSSASASSQEILDARRVTRSLTAAHAAVAHPSMFELVGSQSLLTLSETFRQGCSLEERNRAMRQQMLELDNHLLVVKSKNKKKAFTQSEDNLLAHGAKRCGVRGDSWQEISEQFLPRKSPDLLKHRYRYLISSKTGSSAVKTYHSQFPVRRNASWIVEEDLRIARGMQEYHQDSKRFARIGTNYIPHRSRLEIRKRWGLLVGKFQDANPEMQNLDESSIEFVAAVRRWLDEKCQMQVVQGQIFPASENERAANATTRRRRNGRHLMKSGGRIPTGAGTQAAETLLDSSECARKNLHPALFFTSWSVISPVTLLGKTCDHNWPSFLEKKPFMQSNHLPILMGTSAVDTQATETPAVEIPLAATEEQSVSQGERNQTAFPAAKSTRSSSARVMTWVAPSQPEKEEGHARTLEQTPSLEDSDDDSDDDSDYEHDELLSSENDESESEFEQMELSDDDEDDEENDGDTDEDGDQQSAASSPLSSAHASPVHHPLRLQNLRKPGNERMKRALEALERRIVGKRVSDVSPRPQPIRLCKPKRYMPLLASESQNRPSMASTAFAPRNHDMIAGRRAVALELEAKGDEEDDDDGDESYECDELLASSDGSSFDDDEEANTDDYDATDETTGENEAEDSDEQDADRDQENFAGASVPNKKMKIAAVRCLVCGRSPCICTNTRMQNLLRRMHGTTSSNSTAPPH